MLKKLIDPASEPLNLEYALEHQSAEIDSVRRALERIFGMTKNDIMTIAKNIGLEKELCLAGLDRVYSHIKEFKKNNEHSEEDWVHDSILFLTDPDSFKKEEESKKLE